MKIVAIIFAVATAICAFGWLNSWVARAALIKHMTEKNTLPADDETKACLVWVWKKLLHMK